jgi:hypothetical protein
MFKIEVQVYTLHNYELVRMRKKSENHCFEKKQTLISRFMTNT